EAEVVQQLARFLSRAFKSAARTGMTLEHAAISGTGKANLEPVRNVARIDRYTRLRSFIMNRRARLAHPRDFGRDVAELQSPAGFDIAAGSHAQKILLVVLEEKRLTGGQCLLGGAREALHQHLLTKPGDVRPNIRGGPRRMPPGHQRSQIHHGWFERK